MIHLAETTSLSWPNMFDVSGNTIAVIENSQSVVSRVRLLILTDPTSLYNEPNQGVGLKRYLWQYNTENQKAIIRDAIVDQLRIHEPCVVADDTQFSDGLMFSGSANDLTQKYNQLNMTVAVKTTFGDTLDITLNDSVEGDS